MNELENSKKKQIIISTIYVVIFLLLTAGVVYMIKPKPNCFDGKLNQNEEKVDCGGVCEEKCETVAEEKIKVEEVGYVASGIVNKYDIYGYVYNPNTFFGSEKFSYNFIIKNNAGEIITEKKGEGFILPGEKKYLIESNVETTQIPSSVELVIGEVKWTKFISSGYQKPELKIVNKNYNEITSGIGFSEALGLLKNDSQFDFEKINIYIILKSANGEIIALNSTQMNTVKSSENRDFRAFWPSRFPGEVRTVETQVDVNVFKSESFSRSNFETERFQEY